MKRDMESSPPPRGAFAFGGRKVPQLGKVSKLWKLSSRGKFAEAANIGRDQVRPARRSGAAATQTVHSGQHLWCGLPPRSRVSAGTDIVTEQNDVGAAIRPVGKCDQLVKVAPRAHVRGYAAFLTAPADGTFIAYASSFYGDIFRLSGTQVRKRHSGAERQDNEIRPADKIDPHVLDSGRGGSHRNLVFRLADRKPYDVVA